MNFLEIAKIVTPKLKVPMNGNPIATDSRNPFGLLKIACALTFAVLAWLGWNSYDSYRVGRLEAEQGNRIVELRGRILYLDEVLTMSARMAATTGEPEWGTRYRTFEPQLNAAIQEARDIAPEAHTTEAAARTDAANIKLVKMETQAFDLVSQGRADEAEEILFGDEYEKQKTAYAQGIVRFATAHYGGRRIAEVRRTIIHLNEVLRMSAYMAAATGDPKWENRYRIFAPQLDAAIREALDIEDKYDHDGARHAAMIDDANAALIEKENRAFDLVRAGRSKEALSLLAGDDFERQRSVHALGIDELEKHLNRTNFASSRAKSNHAIWRFIAILLIIAITTGAWLVVLRLLRNWQEKLAMANAALVAKGEELSDLNESLDQRVEDQTSELREAKDYITNIITSMIDMLLVVASDGTVRTVNNATCKALGYREEELIGLSSSVLFSEEEEEEEALPFKRSVLRGLVKDDAIRNVEKSLLAKSGHTIPVLLSGSVMRDKDDSIRAIVCVAHDITERKNAEAKLRKLSVAVEQSPASIVITDTKGTIEYVNPRFIEVTGYTAEEAIGQNPRILAGGNKPKESYKKLWDTILAGRIWTGAFENKKKNGELYWEEASICPIRDAKGAVTHFLAVKQDITRAKSIEKTLREKEAELRKHRDNLEALVSDRTAELAKSNDTLIHEVQERREAEIAAEKASSAKGDFLATMSHELRTPLNGIIGMTELLLGSGLTREQKRQAGLVKASGDILLRLINDIVDFSKIEAGKLELEVRDFDLRNSVECVATLLGPQAEKKGLELTVGVNPAVPTAVRGDPGRLQQILTNLVSNAIKFTEHGQIIIRAVVDDEDESSSSVRISVTDTGIGIPPEKQGSLFQSFSQLDASHSRRFGGTGLGLAISKQLVEMMGGEIGAISGTEPGSTFWFSVTLKKGVETHRPLQIPSDFRQLRVLAVDDNTTNREILVEQLTGFGIELELAADGDHALTALRKAAGSGNAFALAIIDLQMPNMDGEQLAQTVKSDPSIRDTVLLLLTSAGIIGDEERMNDLGFSAWLPKPIRQSQLLVAITQALACARVDASHGLDETTDSPLVSTQRLVTTGAKILAAEDNEIGQEVIRQVLRQAGYTYEIVANGRDAVDAWHNGVFDLILMDCQMPGMDGFEAAREIRALEKENAHDASRLPRTPIVALTANALKGDREKCLEAGMDDHIAKPFDPSQLIEAIESQLASREKQEMTSVDSGFKGRKNDDDTSASPPGCPVDDTLPPFEMDIVLKRWGGDRVFVQKLIGQFLAMAPSELDRLVEVAARGDIEETTRLAHGLKGAAAYCGAERFRESASRLEVMGRANDLEGADDCLRELRLEMDRCLAHMQPKVASDAGIVESIHNAGHIECES